MKKNIVIIGSLILVVVLGYAYFWYKNNPPRTKLSKEGMVCYEKCRDILRENFKKCGEDCYTGAPFFAYDKTSGKCLSNVDIEGTNYINLYVNDCKTDTYISRWNPTKEELSKLSAERINTLQLEFVSKHTKMLEELIDLSSKKVEGYLFGP